jgi:hypothetical protein
MSPRSSHRLSRFALCTLVLCAAGAHANLLVNGSFESGTFNPPSAATMSLAPGSTAISGWTVVNDVAAWIGTGNPWGLSANDGARFLDLTDYSTGAPFGGVAQAIATLPGASYRLSFDLGSSTFWGRPDAITASAAGQSATFTSPGTGTNNDWQHVSMLFTASSNSTTVQLLGVAGHQYIGLDNAAVDLVSTPVPEPQTWASMVGGLVCAGAWLRRRAKPSATIGR